jgi:hypothetical protein
MIEDIRDVLQQVIPEEEPRSLSSGGLHRLSLIENATRHRAG